MNKQQANSIIDNTFNGTFNRETFNDFIGNLLNLRSHNFVLQNINIYDSYKQHINSFELVAKYSDGQNDIDVLIVALVKDTSLDRARTMQRNFIARYLNEKQGDAAIVGFYSPGANDWRFSLIKMEYQFDQTETGFQFKQEINHNLSAKRWSFLVGKNERSHTAQKQLVDILANDQTSPSLDDLEHAFNIESVTKEFFEKYTDLFHRIKESLDALVDQDQQLKSEFKLKEIDSSDFAKKTLGQMAFLYFLQKKGWFGVAPGQDWGTGVKNFLRKVFERREKYGENFFDDVLEPLFYEALAQDRGNESIYPKLNNCRMPFLNGGLFEPMNGYSWETTHIRLPDNLFSNKNKTKEGDIGDGILDIFDRYNFTVNESDPLEMEVAVDPEMLGKVFENLLEIKDRRSKGTFYTPREIVKYMCQESLIKYLDTSTNSLIPNHDIEFFIRKGSQIIQNDKAVISKGEDSEDLKFILPQSIVDQSSVLDSLLKDIKICDPAVGSGAFPLGMLNEIIGARLLLGIHLNTNPTSYDLKLHAISNSIYGVDIDPGAIEIAKLRLWLSLVVEENNPTPLPNLDHKIMQGNSLVSKYAEIELFDDDYLKRTDSVKSEKQEIQDKLEAIQKEYLSLNSSGELTVERKQEIEKIAITFQKKLKHLNQKLNDVGESADLFDDEKSKKIAQQKSKLLQKKIKYYVTVASKTEKENLKKEIDNLKWDLIESALQEKNEINKLNEIKDLRKKNVKPFFIWKLEFGNVFVDDLGFDVVIANPPYVSHDEIEDYEKKYIKSNFESFQSFADLYCYFIELGVSLLKNNGILCSITSNSYLKADYGKSLRQFLINKSDILQIINVEKYQLFDEATVNTAVLMVQKGKHDDTNCKIVNAEYDQKLNFLNFVNSREYYYEQSDFLSNSWTLAKRNQLVLIKKIANHGKTLAQLKTKIRLGIATGANDAFIINKEKKDYLISLDKLNSEIIKPVLKGKDIDRYSYKQPSNYILLTKNGIDVKNEYPSVYNYLSEFGDKFKERGAKGQHWTNLRACAFFDDFKLEKIIWIELSDKGRFALCDEEIFLVNSAYFLIPPTEYSSKYLLAILNSKVIQFYLSVIAGTSGMGTLRWINTYVNQIPIPPQNRAIEQDIEQVVDQIITCKKTESPNETIILEETIDNLVCDLYGLSSEDREIIFSE